MRLKYPYEFSPITFLFPLTQEIMDQPVKAESDREVQRMELNAPNTEHANNS